MKVADIQDEMGRVIGDLVEAKGDVTLLITGGIVMLGTVGEVTQDVIGFVLTESNNVLFSKGQIVSLRVENVIAVAYER